MPINRFFNLMRNELFLSKRLETATFKLNLLLEITQSINDNLSTKELLDTYKKILVTNFSVGSFLLFVKNIDWQCVLNNGIYGIEDSDVNQFVEDFLHQLTDIENIVFINKLFVVIPITHHEKALAYLLITDKAKQKPSIRCRSASRS